MAKSTLRDRLSNTVNAGSMADIAFLLLIFFLVTTTIDQDKGIAVKLPPWTDEEIKTDVPRRNVLSVLVNADNRLLVRGEPLAIGTLRDHTKQFLTNPEQRADYPRSPRHAVVSLRNDRGTDYAAYLAVYNELKAAYDELWEARAQTDYGKAYADLELAARKEIRSTIPLVISEVEPTAFGVE